MAEDNSRRLTWGAIERFAAEFEHDRPMVVADRLISSLSDDAIRAFAVLHVIDVIDAYRRMRAREAEARAEEAGRRAAMLAAREREAEEHAQRMAECREEEKRQRKRATELARTRPERKAAARAVAAEAEARLFVTFEDLRDNPNTVVELSEPDRERFRSWMGEAYRDWYDAHTRDTPHGRAGLREAFEPFVEDAHADHKFAYYLSRMTIRLWDYGQEQAARARLEITQELLGTSFALGDGTKTTWGAASREQHECRAAMLIKQAAGTTETAVRHMVAMRMIDEAGAATLSDIAMARAA